MSNAVFKGNASGSGTVTLETPNTNTDRTISLPDATGTVMVSGNMPAFSATPNAGTSIPNVTFTKVAFQTKNFDTANCFDATTNYRFTPTVAGYYQINGEVGLGTAQFPCLAVLYKNGLAYLYGAVGGFQISQINTQSNVSAVVYLNGSTDYVELYVIQASGTTQSTQTGVASQFSGILIRAA